MNVSEFQKKLITGIKTTKDCETLFERLKKENASLIFLGLVSQHYRNLKARDEAFEQMYSEAHNV